MKLKSHGPASDLGPVWEVWSAQKLLHPSASSSALVAEASGDWGKVTGGNIAIPCNFLLSTTT